MRRHILHIAVALLTFTVSFLFASTYNNLTFALPAALTAFALTKIIPELNIDPHYLKAAAITLLLWIIVVYFILTIFLPPEGSCVAISYADDEPVIEAEQDEPADNQESHTNELMGITAYSCEGAPYTLTTLNTVWAGVMDRKALAKPAPSYPALAKSAAVSGTVAVSVVVDESGNVVWVQSLSGHPLLRQAAMEAACRAQFHPLLVDGPSLRASGVLTYSFGHKRSK